MRRSPSSDQIRNTHARSLTEERQIFDANKMTIGALERDLGDLTGIGVMTYVVRLERLGLVVSLPTTGGDIHAREFVPTHLLEELMALTAEAPPNPKRPTR
jgi:hypothetical protein